MSWLVEHEQAIAWAIYGLAAVASAVAWGIELWKRRRANRQGSLDSCRRNVRLGPARYYRPVCVRGPQGFIGSPSGYREVPAAERKRGPLIVDHADLTRKGT